MAIVEFSGIALHPSQVVLTAFDISVIGAVMIVVVVVGVVVIGVVVDTENQCQWRLGRPPNWNHHRGNLHRSVWGRLASLVNGWCRNECRCYLWDCSGKRHDC